MRSKKPELQIIPVLPLRDVVVFPYMVMPLFVGRPKSISSLDDAMQNNKKLLLVSQKQADLEEPSIDDLYDVGTIANIIQLLKLPDGTVKVLVEGQQRAKIRKVEECPNSCRLTKIRMAKIKARRVCKRISLVGYGLTLSMFQTTYQGRGRLKNIRNV